MGIEASITLGDVLGEGASAVTYKATDSKGRTVCVKQYKTSVQSSDAERIQREMDVLKRINHPQVPTVFASYIQQVNGRDLLHIVQEFVDGQDLQTWLKSNTLRMSETRQILADTLGVLEYLHNVTPPILHRDIKPSNLMRRLDGRVVLIDFGQAVQDVHRTLGQTMVAGTIGYQAPEQISGNATVKSDVYSVGVVAVEILTGTPAFKMLEGQSLRWERHCRRLPLPVQEWLDGVLHPEPSLRWDAAEALQRLQQLGTVFVDSSVGIDYPLSSAGSASTDFLNMLDGAIQDESEKQRHQREIEYRRQVESDRLAEQRRQQEEQWHQTEMHLWDEMLTSWEQVLSAIQAKKVSSENGMKVFRTAFLLRVEECKNDRKWGYFDERFSILLDYASNLPSSESVKRYEDWVEQVFFNNRESKLKTTSLRETHVQRECAMIKQELGLLSWWGLLWKKSALEKQLSDFEKELVDLQNNIEQQLTELRGIVERYRVYDPNLLRERRNKWNRIQESQTFSMVRVPAGSFEMGALVDDEQATEDEKVCPKIVLTTDILVAQYPVTQKIWCIVMGGNPSCFQSVSSDDHPVESVNWLDCLAFCNALSKIEGRTPVYEGLDGYQTMSAVEDSDIRILAQRVRMIKENDGYRLLTEAEWEYAARGGPFSHHVYAGSDDIAEVAWYEENSDAQTHPVGQKKPNKFGLYDMSGNVLEWCWDTFEWYTSGVHVDPVRNSDEPMRVMRGGSIHASSFYIRSSYRGCNVPETTGNALGFRICRSL